MSLPPVNPDKTAAGIAIDPVTQTRVVPESRRPDGSVRKEIRIRPGFTPQEDVTRFRGSRQKQMDGNALPKGHILGWVAPSSESKPKPKEGASKSAKKNEKRKAKREQAKQDIIRASWESDDDDAGNLPSTPTSKKKDTKEEAKKATDQPIDDVAEVETKLEKLELES